jgi:hypothetical protein
MYYFWCFAIAHVIEKTIQCDQSSDEACVNRAIWEYSKSVTELCCRLVALHNQSLAIETIKSLCSDVIKRTQPFWPIHEHLHIFLDARLDKKRAKQRRHQWKWKFSLCFKCPRIISAVLLYYFAWRKGGICRLAHSSYTEMQCWVPRLCLTFVVSCMCHQWLHTLQVLAILSCIWFIVHNCHGSPVGSIRKCIYVNGYRTS